ncbi:hypothetical protein IAD21_03047 [Abditibacteriota bacterium]|nr:hypothetical protein IAD21_03047 [Abditibacteriota bacterium]
MKRRGALGMISHITPIMLPVFIVLFYTPVIALPLRVHGWGRAAALGIGFLIPLVWLALGLTTIALIPARFDKLKGALEVGILGLPMLGMIGILLWDLVSFLWRLAY